MLKRSSEFAGKRISGRRLDWCLYNLLAKLERRLVDRAYEKAEGGVLIALPTRSPPHPLRSAAWPPAPLFGAI